MLDSRVSFIGPTQIVVVVVVVDFVVNIKSVALVGIPPLSKRVFILVL